MYDILNLMRSLLLLTIRPSREVRRDPRKREGEMKSQWGATYKGFAVCMRIGWPNECRSTLKSWCHVLACIKNSSGRTVQGLSNALCNQLSLTSLKTWRSDNVSLKSSFRTKLSSYYWKGLNHKYTGTYMPSLSPRTHFKKGEDRGAGAMSGETPRNIDTNAPIPESGKQRTMIETGPNAV